LADIKIVKKFTV